MSLQYTTLPLWLSSIGLKDYEYEPLDTSEQTIRLFRLHYCSSNFMRGELEHFKISEAPVYRALSYTWGTAEGSKTIRVKSRAFKIRPNLFSFFEVFKTRHLDEWLWVDQICIDQTTTAERNHQVQLMSHIYRGAKEVIIWLNPETRENVPGDPKCTASCQMSGHAYPGGICTWLRALYRHEYWTRLWIIQEVLLAPALAIWNGNKILTWEEIEKFQKPGDVALRLYFLINAASMIKHGALSLTTVIRHFTSGSRCEDPRDLVFGLQALVYESERLTVDYTQCLEEVFIDAVMKLIDTGDDLRLMYLDCWHLAVAMKLKLAHIPEYDPFRFVFAVAELQRNAGFNRWFRKSNLREPLVLATECRNMALYKWLDDWRLQRRITTQEWSDVLAYLNDGRQ